MMSISMCMMSMLCSSYLQVINPACTQVLQTTFGDGVDNDCDARIDEEFCDGQGLCVCLPCPHLLWFDINHGTEAVLLCQKRQLVVSLLHLYSWIYSYELSIIISGVLPENYTNLW